VLPITKKASKTETGYQRPFLSLNGKSDEAGRQRESIRNRPGQPSQAGKSRVKPQAFSLNAQLSILRNMPKDIAQFAFGFSDFARFFPDIRPSLSTPVAALVL